VQATPVGDSLFDWGLPFFCGTRILTAIEGRHTGAGTRPFSAY
jgi:hypothetical protein